MNAVKYYEPDRGIVHAEGDGGNDYTLCGLTTEGTIHANEDDYHSEIVPRLIITKGRVTCPSCLSIINYVLKNYKELLNST